MTVLARVNPSGTSFLDFATPEIAHAQGQGQLAWYLELERQGVCRLIRSRGDLEGHLAAREGSPSPPAQTPLPISGEGRTKGAALLRIPGEGRTKAPSPPAPLPPGEGETASVDSTTGRETMSGSAAPLSPPTPLPRGEGGLGPLGFVLSMEGADPIVGPGSLGAWVAQGLRIVSLAHYGPSRYAHGTKSTGGLFPTTPEGLRGGIVR